MVCKLSLEAELSSQNSFRVLETLDQFFIGHVIYYYAIRQENCVLIEQVMMIPCSNYLNPAALIDKPVWYVLQLKLCVTF